MKKPIRIIGGYQNTRINDECFAITPFLFLVEYFGRKIKIIGIGICWGYYAFFIALSFGISKKYPVLKFWK